jgi:predicted dehydrogenase
MGGKMSANPAIRFAAIGMNHGHIYGQVDLLLRAGAELVSFFAPEADLAADFSQRYPQARLARSSGEILEDSSIQMVVSAAVPDQRGPLGVEVMRHGKDYMSDKPAFTNLEQLALARQVQAETGRIFSVCYSERLENPATVRAGELARAGAIGKVVQTIGMGPHRTTLATRPAWFFQRERYGGILTDIAAHQMDQFLYFTSATSAEVVSAQVANYKHPEHPGLEDFGEALLRTDGATGFIRVDWFTPDGLEVWGDARLFVLGTEGYMEIRKYTDLRGRAGGNHLLWVDAQGTHYEDCTGGDLPYGRQLIQDVLERSETAMSQAHCFLAMELALTAEAKATRLGHLC